MEYTTYIGSSVIEGWHEWLSLGIALTTNFGAIWMIAVSVIWWWTLRRQSETDFTGWFLGTAAVMIGIFIWTLTGLLQLLYFDIQLPLISLPARIFMCIGVWIKVWKTTHHKPRDSERIARAFRQDLSEELTHHHTPELDGLLRRVDSLTSVEINENLLPLLLDRVGNLRDTTNISEYEAAVMYPLVMRREKRKRLLRTMREDG